MKAFWGIFTIVIVLWVLYAYVIGSLLSEAGKAVHDNGGLGSIVGKEIHNFNEAKEGK